jgi:hypothetical protein
MENINKSSFIKSKIRNLILYIEETFGKNNILLREFGPYIDIDKQGFEVFLQAIVQLAKIFHLPADTEEKKAKNLEIMRNYLASKNLRAKDESLIKLLRYLEMFLEII